MKERTFTPAAMGLACAAMTALMWIPSSHGELICVPEEHDFGEVVLGDSSTFDVTVTSVDRQFASTDRVFIFTHGDPSFSSSLDVEHVIIANSRPEQLVDVGGALFFAADDGDHGMELWRSDGTADGTVMVKDLWPGPDGSLIRSSSGKMTACAGAIYFSCYGEGSPAELCRSDGTELGTGRVADINPGGASFPRELSCWDGTLFFSADDGIHGHELWRSDGTPAGTYMVTDIHPTDSSNPTELVVMDGVLYFAASDGVHGEELWRSDGTAAGTVLVKDVLPGLARSTPSELTAVDGLLFFAAYDYDHGQELWESDGTEAGTVLVKDIMPGNPIPLDRPIMGLTAVGDLLFFVADDGVTGRELWKSDGTEAGTVLVKDIIPGEASSAAYPLAEKEGVLYLSAAASPDSPFWYALWRSDGTTAGTVMVKDIHVQGRRATALGSTLYLTARDESTGYELWKSDGTEAGTLLVRDIDPGDSSYPADLAVSDGVLYFVAYDPLYSRELFRSDGSYLGTSMVQDIRPGGDPTIEVDVTFTPTAAGPVSGSLHLWGERNHVDVPLEGTGVAPGPTPEELIVEILMTFDAAVADGTLVGSGPGASAAGRLGALRNMLVAAQGLIDDGDIAAACVQLLDAFNRTDGEPIPPDFVGGDAAPVLAAMIADLRDLLECD